MKLWPTKDPDEVLDYSYDWAPDLEAGETLNPAETEFLPVNLGGLVIESTATGTNFFSVTFSGGTDGEEATFTLRVTTQGGTEVRTFEDTVVLPIASTPVASAHPGDYTPPTVGHLLFLYPEFASVPPTRIEYYLTRAGQSVDESWTEGDFGHGRILLAAHLMTLAGLGDTPEAAAALDGSDQYKSIGVASLRLERFDKAKSGSAYCRTRYGREFQQLIRLNKGGVRVTGAVPGRFGDGDNFGPWTA